MATKTSTVYEVVRTDRAGEEETVQTFDTLAEAEAFAKTCREYAEIDYDTDKRPRYAVFETEWVRPA